MKKTNDATQTIITNQAGFALLEGLIATVILAIGILAVAAMQNGAVRNNAFAWEVTNQTFDGKQAIEATKPMSYDNENLKDGIDDTETDKHITTRTVVSENSIYNNTKRVTVTISWQSHRTDRPNTIVMDHIKNNM